MFPNKNKIKIDTDLVVRLRQGDNDAFHQLVNQYHSKLLAVARAIVGEAFADEVVQDSWEAVIKSIHQFEGRSTLLTWLTQIVSNRAKSRLKRESRQRSLDEGWQDPDSHDFDQHGGWAQPVLPWHEDTPEALLSSSELRQLIAESIRHLPEKQKAVINLHDLEGIGFKEICNILDVSPSNVRVLLHRACLAVKKAIDEYQNK